jgi:hypothetical protein
MQKIAAAAFVAAVVAGQCNNYGKLFNRWVAVIYLAISCPRPNDATHI